MSHEEIQLALDQYAAAENKQMTETLLCPIREIARTGSVCYKWQSLVGVLLHQLRSILQPESSSPRAPGEEEPAGLAGDGSYEESCTRLYGLLLSFEGPPFTIQRICELLLQPHQHHKTKRKLLYALDKLLSVTTIVAEQSLPPPPPLAKVHDQGTSNHSGDMEGTERGAAGGCAATSAADRGQADDTPMGENLINGFATSTASVAGAAAGPVAGAGGEETGESMQTEARPGGEGLEDSAMAA